MKKIWTGDDWLKCFGYKDCNTCFGKGYIPCEDDQDYSIKEQPCPNCYKRRKKALKKVKRK